MKIGIVTQPLTHNYGGILQDYAFQQVLKRMGHEPITLDYIWTYPFWRFLLHQVKTLLLYFSPSRKRPFIKYKRFEKRSGKTMHFVEKQIDRTKTIYSYTSSLITNYKLDALVVGSDQVWRPVYNPDLQDMFLRFAKAYDIPKIAYAASFGVDHWEFSNRQTRKCKKLITQFDAVSVRETSGIRLCEDYLACKATAVLDPTLLLSKDDYSTVCASVPVEGKGYLAAYVLDVDEEKRGFINRIATKLNLPVKFFTSQTNATLTIEEWLASFRDAAFVVTDSFHGTVFSIIFQKEFVSIANLVRGLSRFESLLSRFGLRNRLVTDYSTSVEFANIDWTETAKIISEQKDASILFLKNALCRK